MIAGMSEYRRDAYVIPLADTVLGECGHKMVTKEVDHAVVIDIMRGSEITANIVMMIFGKGNAEREAALLNEWRDQTRFKQ